MRIPFLIAIILPAAFVCMSAQTKAPDNWFNLDPKENNVNGVSSDRVYNELLKNKKSQTVIVAVIDGGVDVNHEDLKAIIWTNPKEIPGNGIDDDGNGFIDDVHGWNFIGGKDGKNVNHETLEKTRVYASLRTKYANADSSKLKGKSLVEYKKYSKLKTEIQNELSEAQESLGQVESTRTIIMNALDALSAKLGEKAITKENLDAIKDGNDQMVNVGKNLMMRLMASGQDVSSIKAVKENLMGQIQEEADHFETKVKYQLNPDYDSRKLIVKDNYADSKEHFYGNADCAGPDPMHGTHVAGIIGAVRDNNLGIKGVADNVRIMSVRCVPDGDERDKDVANAIIYAVDNGASVINMSFGKGQSWDKATVDRAVKYARDHDVLLVHAAGNEGVNTNGFSNNYPNSKFEKAGCFAKKTASNWIEVGALSWQKGEDEVATFSNYGDKIVDVFSPGVDLKSTVPGNKYRDLSGTSMASPVTAGVAAMLRSYFPELTAEQVKECIEKSVIKQDFKVKKPGSDELVPFSTLSRTGGIVSAYEAVKIAQQMHGKKKLSAPKA